MKTVWVAWSFFFLPLAGIGCDVCGIYLGIQPQDRTSSISLLWRYRHLQGDVLVGGIPPATPKHGGHVSGVTTPRLAHLRELYQVAEVRADLWLSDRWALLMSVPFVNNYRAVDGFVTSDVYGMGDPLLIGRYMVANTKCKTLDERVVHRLMLGAGAKLPLGRDDMTYNGVTVDVDQQPGTGTWDALFSAEYLMRYKRNGAGVTMIGRHNGTNVDGYQLGHGLSTTVELFRRYDYGDDWKWLPSVGMYHELSGKDVQNEEFVRGTGSSTLFTHVGSRVWWRSWAFSATFQYAVAYDLGETMVPNKERIVIGMTYNLIKKTKTT